MTLIVDGFAFDNYDGVIQLPRQRVAVFSPAHVAYSGTQLFPLVGDPFTIEVTRFETAANLQATVNSILLKHGVLGVVSRDGLDFSLTPYFLLFHVEVEIVSATIVGQVITHRNGVNYTYSPASMVKAKLTMRANPSS